MKRKWREKEKRREKEKWKEKKKKERKKKKRKKKRSGHQRHGHAKEVQKRDGSFECAAMCRQVWTRMKTQPYHARLK